MNDLKLGIVFDVKNGRFKSEVKQNTQVVEQLGHSTQRTAGQTRQLDTALDNTNHKLITTNRVAQSVTRAIGGLAAGFGALQLGKGLVTELAVFQDIRTRLQGLSESSADYAAKERWLIDLATEHHKELNGLADGYSRLSTLTQEKIITDGQARDMLEGLSNAASRNGAGTADLERVYYGLSQALGAGTVNMEDFKQVTEPLPDLMAKIARAAGQETSSGLKQLIGTGTYTSEVFGKHLVTALQDYAGASAKTADNINAKYRDIKREYQLLAVELEQPINSALLPTLDGLTEGLSFLKEHTEGVITVLETGLVLAAGHASTALLTKAAAIKTTIVAHRAQAQAALAAAKSDQTLAASTHQKAVQEQAAAKRSLANATNTYARTRAVKNLAIANGQLLTAEKSLIVTTNALTASTTRARLVTQAMSISTRALSGSMALLGGPVGVAMLAGFALYSFATSNDEASNKTKALTIDINTLTETYKELSAVQLRDRLLKLNEDLTSQNSIIEKQTSLIEQEKNAKTSYYDNELKRTIEIGGQTQKSKDIAVKAEATKETATIAYNKQLALQAKLKEQLSFLDGGGKPDSAPDTKTPSVTTPTLDKNLGQDLAKVEQSLLNKEGVINASYLRQQSIVDNSLANKLISEKKYNALSLQLDAKKDLALKALSDQKAAQEKERAESKAAAVQKTIDDEIQSKLNARELLDQQRRDSWDLELAELRGYHSLKEGEEAAHNERVMSVKTRKTGDMQGTLMQFANFEKKTQLEKTSAVIGIGEYGFKAMAGQSKKAFAMYKAFSIGQALIKTYEAATGAYASLAPIPVVGPALGVAAAAAAVVSGLGQVRQIRSQQPQGMAHDGIDEIPREGTWLLDKGERVVDSRTNQDLKQAIKGGGMGGSKVTVNLIEDASKAGQVSQSKGLNGEDVIRIFVADIRQGGDSADAMELTYGLQRTGT
jgi:tape measure domain-containing protein